MGIEKPRVPANANEEMPLDRALAELHLIRQQVMTEGRVDSEHDQFMQLIIGVRNGEIAPTEGVRRARALEASRQEPH